MVTDKNGGEVRVGDEVISLCTFTPRTGGIVHGIRSKTDQQVCVQFPGWTGGHEGDLFGNYDDGRSASTPGSKELWWLYPSEFEVVNKEEFNIYN